MWQFFNNNPLGKNVGDCSVRAVSKALEIPWSTAYTQLTLQGYAMCDMPSSNSVIGMLLKQNGFTFEAPQNECPDCYTLEEFSNENQTGTFVVFMDKHVCVVKDGIIFDAWDSSHEIPIYFWRKD